MISTLMAAIDSLNLDMLNVKDAVFNGKDFMCSFRDVICPKIVCKLS